MRLTIALVCCFTAAAMEGQATRARITLPGYRDAFPIEDVATPFELNAPIARAYDAIKGAFDDLKVPLDVNDGSGAVVGNKNIHALVSFAGFRLSRIVNCGSSPIGQNADSFKVSLVLLALLDSTDAKHTKVRVGFVGGAEPIAGALRQGVQCGSTGLLEAKLIELASSRLH